MRTGIFGAPSAFFIVMNICDLKRGEAALVLSVEGDRPLRERLNVLGVYAGARIVLLKISLFGKTFLLSTASGKVALGRTVAVGVKVCRAR